MSTTVTAIANGTDTRHEDIALTQQILLVIIFLAVLIFICGGNLLTILAVWRTPALRTVPNMYVISLAVADLLTGCMIPYYCISFFPSLQQHLDTHKYLCLFRYVFFHICVAESLACMVIISFDRFLFIKYPLHYKTLTSPGKAGVVIAASWVISTSLGMVILWVNGWESNRGCDSFAILTRGFRMGGLMPCFFVICLVTAICYGYMVRTAMRHQREARERRMAQLSESHASVVSNRNDWKSIKVFLLVYGVFVMCWCPNFILLIVRYYYDIPLSIVYFTVVLGFLNSGMNCIIYAWQNRHFRNAFKTLLCGK